MLRNRVQAREEKSAQACGFCNPLQGTEIPLVSLVMSRGKRFESARRLFIFPANSVKNEKPTMLVSRALSAVRQQ